MKRFVGSIDDVNYIHWFSEFDPQRLVQEASGLPLDLGEKVTLFLFGQAHKAGSEMDYKFAGMV